MDQVRLKKWKISMSNKPNLIKLLLRFTSPVKNRVRSSDRLDWQEAPAGGWNQGALARGGDFARPSQGFHPAAAESVRRRSLHAHGAEP